MITYPTEDDFTQTVLVVDDEPGNLQMLTATLEAEGYEVVTASRGEEALVKLGESPPDVILLDVAMPGMDGIELCRQINSDPETTHIPILLMTAHRRREKRLDGISAGARDFLLKPLDIPDLRIRLRNAAEMKRLYDESQEQLRTITELEGLRDSLVHMIVHDLKAPLTSVIGNLELLGLILPQGLDPDIQKAFDGSLNGAHKMNEMVRSILTVSKLESGRISLDLREESLHELSKEAISLLGPKGDQVQVERSPSGTRVHASLDSDLIQRVLLNLLSNALDHSPKEAVVLLQLSQVAEWARVAVTDSGPGIPEEYREKIFEKFSQVGALRTIRKTSVGLGLAFCKLAIEAHGGKIGVDCPDTGGSVFWFEIPMS